MADLKTNFPRRFVTSLPNSPLYSAEGKYLRPMLYGSPVNSNHRYLITKESRLAQHLSRKVSRCVMTEETYEVKKTCDKMIGTDETSPSSSGNLHKDGRYWSRASEISSEDTIPLENIYDPGEEVSVIHLPLYPNKTLYYSHFRPYSDSTTLTATSDRTTLGSGDAPRYRAYSRRGSATEDTSLRTSSLHSQDISRSVINDLRNKQDGREEKTSFGRKLSNFFCFNCSKT